jgi:RNA polymerase sigma-70 factor, ECF subfamily
MSAYFGDQIVETLPRLHAVARQVARDRSLAQDLVQDTVLRALTHADRFAPGTNLDAWLVTILKNSHFDELRRRKRRAQVTATFLAETAATSGEQEAHLDMRDCERALDTLPPAQRQALMLVGAEGWSYEAAARKAGCGLGTMKSRTSRARLRLRQLLDGEKPAQRFEKEAA